MKVNNDPFNKDLFADEASSSEETPQSQENPQETKAQELSFEAIYKILRGKGIVHTALGEYEIITELSRIGRTWECDSYGTLNGKRLDELILPSEQSSSRVEDTEDIPPTSFVKRAAQKHLEQCKKVQALIEERDREKGQRKKVRLLKIFGLLLLLAFLAGGGYLFIRSRKPKGTQDFTSAVGEFSLEYTTIRGTVETDQYGVPTVILNKTDVVTIRVVDKTTGETVAQGIINIKLIED